MILKLTVDDQTYDIDIPENLVFEAEEFYKKMDADMDKGWQMSRRWVEKPDGYQRCQIAADKVYGAMHQENKKLMLLWAGYIISRRPGTVQIFMDTEGDITQSVLEP